jgi:hypothetical protein
VRENIGGSQDLKSSSTDLPVRSTIPSVLNS